MLTKTAAWLLKLRKWLLNRLLNCFADRLNLQRHMLWTVCFVLPHEGFDRTSDAALGDCVGRSTAVGYVLPARRSGR